MKLPHLTLALTIAFCFSLLDQSAKAEPKFTPWRQGDYQVEKEKIGFIIDAEISGGYEARYDLRREGVIMGDDIGNKINQDIILEIESRVNSNLSLKVTIGNRSPWIADQQPAYRGEDTVEQGDNYENETGMDLVFKQAYLEYNHNPHASLKIGKQYIYPGDGKGLIFQGEALAISQECSIGTWCYYLGMSRLGDNSANALFWGHLRYPVYQSGIKKVDLWSKEGVRDETALNVEVFRVSYRGKETPLSTSGGWTGEGSTYHDTTSDADNAENIYFDNDGIEYMGLNLKWTFHKLNLDFTYIGVSGSRDYYSGAVNDRNASSLGDRAVSGFAYLLNADYMFKEYWKLGLTFFMSSGNDVNEDGDRYWRGDSSAFQEVQKGSYYDALIYFDMRNNLSDQYTLSGTRVGDGHSVGNLQYLALKYSLKLVRHKLDMDVSFYSFRRAKPVFINNIGDNEKENDIGDELDVKVKWMLEKRLELNFFIGLFQPRGAYAVNDSLRPVKDQQELFSLMGASCTYTF